MSQRARGGRAIVRALGAVALLGLATAAAAQVDCGRVPDSLRARCEEANRVNEACAGVTGAELNACRQKQAARSATRDDCTDLRGYLRRKCQSAALASSCTGKAGKELSECVREHAGSAGAR